jgi:hypothetical protein
MMTCSSVVGCGTRLQAGRLRVPFLTSSLDYINWTNPSSRTIILRSIQPITQMSTRDLVGRKDGRKAFKADNITAIC